MTMENGELCRYREDEDVKSRNAMRAYLQRAEVRLSTMHRIGASFISGAGLLLIFSMFFEDSFRVVFNFTINVAVNIVNSGGLFFNIVYVVASIFPFVMTLVIPLLSVYLLLRDITIFYFSPYVPGEKTKSFYPRFSLAALLFSPDESESVKDTVYEHEYNADKGLYHFILPYYHKSLDYYKDVYSKNRQDVVPSSRADLTKYASSDNFNAINAAIGLAGGLDRELSAEVAKMEVSQVRHALRLRRLVLRYIKALIVCIVTALSSYFMISIIEMWNFDTHISSAKQLAGWLNSKCDVVQTMYGAYIVWAIVTAVSVRFPVYWIYSQASKNDVMKIPDRHLVRFENVVRLLCAVSVITSLLVILKS
jgi:hypothetical protein